MTGRPETRTAAKERRFQEVAGRLRALVGRERDEIAVMATIACELARSLDGFHWVGFYRVTEPGLLKIGPYQGAHGCLSIPFSRGVCGRCATTRQTQIVADVTLIPWHIACSSTTRSEIVVPAFDDAGNLRAVLDVDSGLPAHFDAADQRFLEEICALLRPCWGAPPPAGA